MSAKPGLGEVLARHGIGLSADEFVAELDAWLSEVGSPMAAPLSVGEIEFLREHGGSHAPKVLDQDRSEAINEMGLLSGGRLVESLASSLSIPEAAELLRVDRSRVSQRISQGSLWTFTVGGSKRLPRWEFAEGGMLPGLAVVIAAIPPGLTAQTLAAFMAEPQAELAGRTPRAHLVEVGDPSQVAELLSGLGSW